MLKQCCISGNHFLIRRAGDSLAGRYFTFHLMPLNLREVLGSGGVGMVAPTSALQFLETVLNRTPSAHAHAAMEKLLDFSGFPEPFVRQSRAFHSKWAREYLDTVIREDIGTLTRIVDREHVFDLYHLLPFMIGSPLSVSSLAAHL